MEVFLWLIGMAVLVLAGVLAAFVFHDRARRLDRRFHASEQAARWRHLQQRRQEAPRARLATVQHVYAGGPRGSRVRIIWTDTRALADLEIEQEQVVPGDFLLLVDVTATGVVGPRNLLARAAWDAPRHAGRIR